MLLFTFIYKDQSPTENFGLFMPLISLVLHGKNKKKGLENLYESLEDSDTALNPA